MMRWVLLAGLCGLSTACGGGGGASGSGSPPVTSSGSATADPASIELSTLSASDRLLSEGDSFFGSRIDNTVAVRVIVDPQSGETLGIDLNAVSENYRHTFDFRAVQPLAGALTGFSQIVDGPRLPDGRLENRLVFDDRLSFASYGMWVHALAESDGAAQVRTFAVGLPTPAADLPKTGTATFTGQTIGVVSGILEPNGVFARTRDLVGDARMSANFGTGAITGDFSNMRAVAPDGSSTPWYPVTFSASLQNNSSHFDGALKFPTINGDPIFGPNGNITGNFHGPGGQEAAGVWSANAGAGIGFGPFSATGGFGVKKN